MVNHGVTASRAALKLAMKRRNSTVNSSVCLATAVRPNGSLGKLSADVSAGSGEFKNCANSGKEFYDGRLRDFLP